MLCTADPGGRFDAENIVQRDAGRDGTASERIVIQDHMQELELLVKGRVGVRVGKCVLLQKIFPQHAGDFHRQAVV